MEVTSRRQLNHINGGVQEQSFANSVFVNNVKDHITFNEHLIMILCNSLMRIPVRCYNKFKGKSKEQT